TISEQMKLTPEQAEHEGRGYLQSSDVVNVGFTQGEDSYVVVQVVYDELAALDDYEGVDITRMTRELTPKSPFGLNPMHITVDGIALDADGFAEWQSAMAQVAGSQRELKYVLRVYGENGNFDDTEPQSLWMVQDQGDLQVKPKRVLDKRRGAAPEGDLIIDS